MVSFLNIDHVLFPRSCPSPLFYIGQGRIAFRLLLHFLRAAALFMADQHDLTPRISSITLMICSPPPIQHLLHTIAHISATAGGPDRRPSCPRTPRATRALWVPSHRCPRGRLPRREARPQGEQAAHGMQVHGMQLSSRTAHCDSTEFEADLLCSVTFIM